MGFSDIYIILFLNIYNVNTLLKIKNNDILN